MEIKSSRIQTAVFFYVNSIRTVSKSDVESITECSSQDDESTWFDVRDFSSESNDKADIENILEEKDVMTRKDSNDEEIKLYDGCQHTVDEAILDLLDDLLNNRETKKSLNDHLSTFIKYLPKSNNLPKSAYHILKYVRNLAPLYKETDYHYCSKYFALQSYDDQPSCICNSSERKVFYGFSIEDQIKHYFEKCRLHEVLRRRKNVKDTTGHL